MSIKIDEHTVAGCPGCNSTDLEEQTYFNHLTGKCDIHVTMCNKCGLIFEPSDAVRIPMSKELTLDDRVKILEEKVKTLEYKLEEKVIILEYLIREGKNE